MAPLLTLAVRKTARSFKKMMPRRSPALSAVGLAVVALLAGGPVLADALNDTGFTTYSGGLITRPAGEEGADAEHGRDAAATAGILVKVGGGNAGFDFTKIDADGKTLPADAVTWSCVLDNVTGLIWEGKNNDYGSLHYQNDKYCWLNTTGVNYGISPGGNDRWAYQDSEWFTGRVNHFHLCGASDWRLPTPMELLSIVDNSRPLYTPLIDTNYFPNTNPGNYWTSYPGFGINDRDGSYFDVAYYVSFYTGYLYAQPKSNYFFIRLVRGGGQ